jgi:outer membrane autotransporter protein
MAASAVNAADFIVTAGGDAGPGTYRDRLNQANASPGPDRILFSVPTVMLNADVAITSDLTIGAPGSGATIQGTGTHNIDRAGPQNVTLGRETTIATTSATGGLSAVNISTFGFGPSSPKTFIVEGSITPGTTTLAGETVGVSAISAFSSAAGPIDITLPAGSLIRTQLGASGIFGIFAGTTVNVQGGTIDASGPGISVPAVFVNMTGGLIRAGTDAISGGNGGTISIAGGTVVGGANGIRLVSGFPSSPTTVSVSGGTVEGTSGAGIATSTAVAIRIGAGATVTGSTGIVGTLAPVTIFPPGFPIPSSTPDSAITATVAGTLRGTGGTAVRFADLPAGQSNLLTLLAGADVVGSLVGGSGRDVLQLGGTGNGAFAGDIAGFDQIEKRGDSRWTLSGHSTDPAPIDVQQGSLVVNGSLGGAATVAAGATLGGSGALGGVTAQTGSAVAPGLANRFSTLTVNGNVSFASGSTFQVNANAAGQADRISATGAATLSGGTVAVLAADGRYRPSTAYTILSASGGVTGTFSGVTSNLAFLDPSLAYTGNTVTLTLALKAGFASAAATRNQASVSNAIENAGSASPLFDAVVGQNATGARQAFDALSGEIHASEVSAAVEGSRLVRDAIMGRLWQGLGATGPAPVVFGAPATDLGARSPAPEAIPVRGFDPQRFALWGQASGTWGRTQRDGNAATLHRESGGFVVGGDATFDGATRIGVAGGFQRTTLGVQGRLSSGSTDSVFGALYGGTALGPVDLRLGASFAGQRTDLRRTIAFPGFADTARSATDGYTAQAFGEIGYPFRFGSSRVEPFVGATALTVHRDRFAEAGGPAALVGFGRDTDVGFTTLGLRTEWQPFDAPVVVRGMTGWRHAFGDVRPSALLAFRSDLATPFAISGVPLDRNVVVGETAVDWRVSEAITLTLAYTGQLARRASDNGVKGQLLAKF